MFGKLRELHEMTKQLELRDREINALRTSNRLYELESDNESRDRVLLREEVAKLSRENAGLKGRENTLELELKIAYSELDEVKTENAYLREKNRELKETNKRLKADYEDLSSDHIALEKAQGELVKAHDEVLAKNLQLESRNEFLENENDALHERVDAHWSVIRKIAKEHPEYLQEVPNNE